MVIKVVGYEHLQGTSRKTGRDYDFYKIHAVTDPDRPVKHLTGGVVLQFNVSPAMVQAVGGLEVGRTYGYSPADAYSPAELRVFVPAVGGGK